MKNVFFLFLTILFCISATAPCFGQKSKTPSAAAKPKLIQAQVVAEFSDAEWKLLADSLVAENWDKSASLSAQLLNRVKIDGEKKQLAQLRYLYIYALAGKILKLQTAKNAVKINAVRGEMIRASADFTGKEFVLPPRQFLGDCRRAFNYVCAVKGDDKALRSVSTDKNGTEIHSFDYISFDRNINLKGFTENKIFVGGILRKVEFNKDMSKPWVMRLVFDKGFARVVVGE